MRVEDSSTPVIVVALALMDGEGRVLMQQRPANKAHGGLWEFPGGKLEAGETCCAALVREIDEELGIVLDEGDLFPISFSTEWLAAKERVMLLLLYGARRWQGEPRPIEAGSALVWASADDISRFAVPPLDVPLVQAVIPLL
ncbi:MAG: (deoxy)nucleoside triphosphate pyrophosphohydrolase [Novosphingobium meiothermophilum]|uniref:(deoxy)nucleoside triphosphate pyrophosphohydrolase n=1 Tax=Novosphingobium TaxID=165696 RepID=UPI000D6E4F56|nr:MULTISPECIES: (deoxy)nucleoside triphosphate pyrophosphohydrolase [Novosphingobium]